MKRMKATTAKKDDNVIVVHLNNTRRIGHNQQRVLVLNPNKRRYSRKERNVRRDD